MLTLIPPLRESTHTSTCYEDDGLVLSEWDHSIKDMIPLYLVELAGESNIIRNELLWVSMLEQNPQLCLALVPQPLKGSLTPGWTHHCHSSAKHRDTVSSVMHDERIYCHVVTFTLNYVC